MYYKSSMGIDDDSEEEFFNQIAEKASTAPETFVCELCADKFTNSASLRRHLLVHFNDDHSDDAVAGEEHVCALCGKRYYHANQFAEHMIRNHCVAPLKLRLRDIHPCAACDRTFSSERAMKAHARLQHGARRRPVDRRSREGAAARTERYDCDVCGRRFHSKPGFLSHARMHRRRRSDEPCGTLCAFADPRERRSRGHDWRRVATAQPYRAAHVPRNAPHEVAAAAGDADSDRDDKSWFRAGAQCYSADSKFYSMTDDDDDESSAGEERKFDVAAVASSAETAVSVDDRRLKQEAQTPAQRFPCVVAAAATSSPTTTRGSAPDSCPAPDSSTGDVTPPLPPPSPIKSFACSICDRKFYTQATMQLHHGTHAQPPMHRCATCAFASSSQFALALHTAVGHGTLPVAQAAQALPAARAPSPVAELAAAAKRFKCERCERAFRTEHTMRMHAQTHAAVGGGAA